MDVDLQLSIGSRYSILSMIFFIPYIIFQFPANIAIRKLGPAVWLPTLVLCWGAVTIGMGFTHSWVQALGCRIILGVLEAGYYPGCVFLLSCWYVRFEVQKRFSGFYLLALLASGFSNILAWGLSEMKGVGGLNGWRWIFIVVSLTFSPFPHLEEIVPSHGKLDAKVFVGRRHNYPPRPLRIPYHHRLP
jgi:MFS family permease